MPHTNEPTAPARKRSVGVVIATCLVVGNMIGSGVFLLPSTLSRFGGLAIVGWIFTSTGAMLLAAVFAALSRRIPNTGGPYIYVRKAFGEAPGFFTAWGHWISLWIGNGAIVTAFVGYLGYFFPAVTSGWATVLIALAALWGLTYVNARGVKEAGVLAVVTTVLKLAPLLLIAVVGLFVIDPSDLPPFNPTGGSALHGVTAAATLTLWAFIGVESATVPADDVRDPRKNIPRATLLGTFVTALVYITTTVVIMALIPADQLSKSTAPFADAARILFGPFGASLVALGALISTFGALNGWILMQGQIPAAAAADGMFPRRFLPNRRGVPVFGLIFSSVLISVLLMLNLTSGLTAVFEQIILLATLASLVPYSLSAAARLQFLIAQRTTRSASDAELSASRAMFIRDAIVAGLALAYSIWAIFGSPVSTLIAGLIIYILGIPVFFLMRRRSRIHVSAERGPQA